MIFKRHFYTTEGNDVYNQTKILFEMIKPYFNSILRTWLFIKDIDKNYSDVSNARNDFFNKMGFEKPYFASTGIGRPDDQFYPGEILHLDILVAPDLKRKELQIMEDLSIMPHTESYNVKFERGVIYKDNYIVSGTASIDEYGNVLYKGNLIKQIYHALFNMDTLLSKYNKSIHNAKSIIGYVRNPENIHIVKRECHKMLPDCEWNIIEGKVCRPDWLVEFELMI